VRRADEMNLDEKFRGYADLAVEVGLGMRAGDKVLIAALVEARAFGLACVDAAYRHGAGVVSVVWLDDAVDRALLKMAPDAGPEKPSPVWSVLNEAASRGDSVLFMTGQDPYLLADLDPDRKAARDRLKAQYLQPLFAKTHASNEVPWAVVAAATDGWAARVFPTVESAEERLTRLWEAIFTACRLDTDDPPREWRRHLAELEARSLHLTSRSFEELRYRGPNTELTVGLPEQHIWAGGSSRTPSGTEFVANLPTEEVFTTPHRDRVDGFVCATKPLAYSGSVIENLRLSFSGGRVVEAGTDQGSDLVGQLLDTDEGASRLGEVALVPMNSPLAALDVVFHNILFDENDGCHLALGEGFRHCLDGGLDMTDAQFSAAGGNVSLIHVDFTVGSRDLDIDGVRRGTVEAVIRDGEWAFPLP
jgi:aminopeptidase